MLRTPAFRVNQYHTLIQYIRQTILHWLKNFGKFSLFYGEYIANPTRPQKLTKGHDQ
ncbi:hypothetical protein [Okeania sp.]|uniref:hypothetical protein n=1 Tax=Okeania sp. TaxID=3100323 RepID=UPI002B4B30F8|nr:hypothetical protein [Okeania sp.]MEB3339532.1 hypothetical protein [Okeania sp.]